jgi:hypothetical protein
MKSTRKKNKRRYRSKKTKGGNLIIPTFHVLILTAGRPDLKIMIDSLVDELKSQDALTIVFDGENAKSKSTYSEEWVSSMKCQVNIKEEVPALGYWGHEGRNKYLKILKPETTFILNADDDDMYVKGSFDILRRKCTDPDVLYIARMKYLTDKGGKPHDTDVVPRVGVSTIRIGNIGTPNGIIPFKDAAKSKFTHVSGGDFGYYDKLKDNVKNTIFLDDIIYNVIHNS